MANNDGRDDVSRGKHMIFSISVALSATILNCFQSGKLLSINFSCSVVLA